MSAEDLLLSDRAKKRATVLIVESDPQERQNIRNALKTLGFGGFTDVPTHLAALEKLKERPVTHIIFDAKKTNIPPREFVEQALEIDKRLILIPSSFEPSVDDVFDLLVQGARGYLCKPFTADTVDIAIGSATKGDPIADSVKQAKDRNEALVAIMMGSLDRVATILRQAEKFETAKRDIPRAMQGFRGSAELAKTFSKGGDVELLAALERFCIDRSNGPATRLGRLRKKLKTTRKDDDPVPATPPAT